MGLKGNILPNLEYLNYEFMSNPVVDLVYHGVDMVAHYAILLLRVLD
jgi:hypothetical protein